MLRLKRERFFFDSEYPVFKRVFRDFAQMSQEDLYNPLDQHGNIWLPDLRPDSERVGVSSEALESGYETSSSQDQDGEIKVS